MTDTLPVVEIVGPTVQGEGPHVGRRSVLVRLGGCNLSCESCDTRYAWDGTEVVSEVTEQAIIDQIMGMAKDPDCCDVKIRPFHHVIITGGEPLIHQGNLIFQSLMLSLVAAGMSIEIETNGTIVPYFWIRDLVGAYNDLAKVSFVVSPKIMGGLATDQEAKRIKLLALSWFIQCPNATFKIVCRTTADIIRIGTWADTMKIPRHHIWIMGEGASWNSHITRTRAFAERILAEGMNISTRLHLALWPATTRGR